MPMSAKRQPGAYSDVVVNNVILLFNNNNIEHKIPNIMLVRNILYMTRIIIILCSTSIIYGGGYIYGCIRVKPVTIKISFFTIWRRRGGGDGHRRCNINLYNIMYCV